MTRAYNCIDADGHILEPLELWADYIDPAYRDHAPRLVRDSRGKHALGSTWPANKRRRLGFQEENERLERYR